jgi:hypothetical protein
MYFSSVPDPDDIYGYAFILDAANETPIPDTVFPEFPKRGSPKALSDATGIFS